MRPHTGPQVLHPSCALSAKVWGCALVDNPFRSGDAGGRGMTLSTAFAIASQECRTASVKPECTSPTSLAPSKNHESGPARHLGLSSNPLDWPCREMLTRHNRRTRRRIHKDHEIAP